jgi:CRP/FNR family transcriptional regulator, cyclic AMP receptor protein
MGWSASRDSEHPVLESRLVMRREASKGIDPQRFVAEFRAGRTFERYKPKQNIFSQGAPADAVFYIREGAVVQTVISNQGKEAVISILGSSDFFGEDCLAGPGFRASTATSITACSLLRFQKGDIIHLLRTEPNFSQHFISYLLARNARMQEDLVDQLCNSSEKRLARVLLSLARLDLDKEYGREAVVPRLSQQLLADMIGTTRSRVSYFMNKFRKRGLIDYDGELRINGSLLSTFLLD